MSAQLSQVDHIVVLMLENRSFDSLLGRLYPKSDGFNGLTGAENNPDDKGVPIPVWNQPGTDDVTMSIPDPDPGELFADINTQLFGSPQIPAAGAVPTMHGFVKSYANQVDRGGAPVRCDPKAVMHYYSPEQVPVLSQLARQFAVCDQWHASAPCQTWPNRFFVHTGTANGYENNSPTHFPYEMPTIFTRFNHLGLNDAWRIYFHDVPQSLALSDLWPHARQFRLFAEFTKDAANGELPSYSFIEPRYFPDVDLPNDQHPPHVVTLAEQLIADVYNSLRNGPGWTRTLLVVTYDEHGGNHDHVPPPAATPPSGSATTPFNFDRYGVRVPVVLISPYIAPGTVIRAPVGAPVFDHTAIIAAVRARFSLGAPLSSRESAAPDLGAVLTLAEPTNLGPTQIEALPFVATPGGIARARLEPLNGMQEALTKLAAHLPMLSAGDDFLSKVQSHISTLKAMVEQLLPPSTINTRADALHFIKGKLDAFFRAC